MLLIGKQNFKTNTQLNRRHSQINKIQVVEIKNIRSKGIEQEHKLNKKRMLTRRNMEPNKK